MPGYASFIDYIINNRPPSIGTHKNWLYSQFVLQLLLEYFCINSVLCRCFTKGQKEENVRGYFFLSDISPNLPKSS